MYKYIYILVGGFNPSKKYEFVSWVLIPNMFLWTMNVHTIGGYFLIKEYQSFPTQQSSFAMGRTQGKSKQPIYVKNA